MRRRARRDQRRRRRTTGGAHGWAVGFGRRSRGLAGRRMGAARRDRRHRRGRRGDRRSPLRVPVPRKVPRRSRGAPAARSQRRRAAPGLPRDARDRSGISAGAAPVPGRVPVLRQRPALTNVRTSRDRRLHGACAGHDRPAGVPGAGEREVHRRRELRAADAHRPQPFVPPAADGAALVACRVVSVSHRCRRGDRADAPRIAEGCRRALDQLDLHARSRSGALRA